MLGVDLFSGAGGMALGAAASGIEVCFAVERDHCAATTYALNHPYTDLFVGDVRELRQIPIDRRGRSTILFGGPPCQGFSTSNQRTRNLGNEDNWLFLESMRVVRLLRPDWVLFENVKGIYETEHGLFLRWILDHFEEMGYTTTCWVLNAAEYGVPQKRERLFIIASAAGIQVQKPKISNRSITVWEAIADLPDLLNGANMNVLPYKCAAESDYAFLMRSGLKECANHLVTKNAQLIIQRYP